MFNTLNKLMLKLFLPVQICFYQNLADLNRFSSMRSSCILFMFLSECMLFFFNMQMYIFLHYDFTNIAFFVNKNLC